MLRSNYIIYPGILIPLLMLVKNSLLQVASPATFL